MRMNKMNKDMLMKIAESIEQHWNGNAIKIIKLELISDTLVGDDFDGVDKIKYTYKWVGKDAIHTHEEVLEDEYLDDCKEWLWEYFLIEIEKEQEMEIENEKA